MACLQAASSAALTQALTTSHVSHAAAEVRSHVRVQLAERLASSSPFLGSRVSAEIGHQSQRHSSASTASVVRAKAESDVQDKDTAADVAEAPAVQSGKETDSDAIQKELSKAVRKTATTFAPRPSTKTKNPATPGSALYKVFEVQAYVSMAFGGLLSFNLIFPSDEPDLWRLMGMWSVWMFTIPSLRARDCAANEKEALNYLFLLVPLINVTLPLVWRSFAVVWTADVAAFCAMYAWKMQWLGSKTESDQS